jgi:hypothetical protein
VVDTTAAEPGPQASIEGKARIIHEER